MLDKEKVIEYIHLNGFCNTQELCREFKVSESTIRRMFDRLDREGEIIRIHGGAVPNNVPVRETAFQRRSRENRDQKIAIAKAAAEMVSENDTVILMGGTTVCEMCPFIEKKKITVITNSILVLNGLRYSENVRIIMLGGLYNFQEEEIGGLMRNSELSRMRVDNMFMGAAGFDEHFGFSITDTSLDLYSSCIESSLKTTVLADSTKYMNGGAVIAARIDQISTLITDTGLCQKTVNAMQETGIKVILADKSE